MQAATLSPIPDTLLAHCSRLRLDMSCPADLSVLLQASFGLPVPGSLSVAEFLAGWLDLPEETVTKVQSVFLNGSPVDDLETAMLDPDCTLALSAALPGLLGATLRRAGYYARLRESISYGRKADPATDHGPFVLRMRLLNMTGRDLAACVLDKGVVLLRDELRTFFARQPAGFWDGINGLELDGQQLDATAYHPQDWDECRAQVLTQILQK